MASPVLQFKRGNAGIAGTVPALRPGEPAISLNNFDFFIGIDTSVANNKFFGSHRYWTRENGTNSLNLNLVDKDGTNSIRLKSPNTLSGSGTYTLPDTNTIVNGYFLKVSTDGTLSWDTASGSGGTFTNSILSGVTTFTGNIDATSAQINSGIVTVTDLYIDTTRVLYDDGSGITLAGIQTIDATTKNTLETILAFDPNNFDSLNVSGIATVGGLLDANGGIDVTGHSELDNVNISGIITASGVVFGSGTAITSVDTDLSSVSASDDTLASAKAIKSYVDTQITAQDLDFAGDTGTGAVDLDSQTFTIAGTANEIETSASGQTITIGLPNNVTIGAGLTVTGALDVNGGGTIDNIRIGVANDNEIDTSTGSLTLDSQIGQTIIDDNLSVTGIATITGAFVANGNVTLGDAVGDVITVNGTTTFNQPIVGTISTATNANNINITSTTSTDTTTSFVLVGNQSTGYQSAFIDSGLSYNANTDSLTITGDVAVNGGDVTTSSTTATIFNTTATNVRAFGAGTNILLGAATGITTISNNLAVGGDIRVNGNDIQASDGNTNITLTSNTLTTFSGDIRVNGNDIQASDGNVNITMTSNTLTEVKGDLKVTGNDIQSSTATALTLSGSDVTVAGDLTVGGSDIKAADGTTSITLTNTTGDVTTANDLTVSGNLYVNGSTTQVNTSSMTVEDRTIELGIVDGSAPSSSTTWDLGVLFNYHDGTAKKSALVWEQTDARFKLGSVVTDGGGTGNSNPQLTLTTYAALEIADLWINNTCTGGATQVIGCISSELNLQNITIDAGTF